MFFSGKILTEDFELKCDLGLLTLEQEESKSRSTFALVNASSGKFKQYDEKLIKAL